MKQQILLFLFTVTNVISAHFHSLFAFFQIFFRDFIYLFERKTPTAEEEGEADFPRSGEPDVGLYPRT